MSKERPVSVEHDSSGDTLDLEMPLEGSPRSLTAKEALDGLRQDLDYRPHPPRGVRAVLDQNESAQYNRFAQVTDAHERQQFVLGLQELRREAVAARSRTSAVNKKAHLPREEGVGQAKKRPASSTRPPVIDDLARLSGKPASKERPSVLTRHSVPEGFEKAITWLWGLPRQELRQVLLDPNSPVLYELYARAGVDADSRERLARELKAVARATNYPAPTFSEQNLRKDTRRVDVPPKEEIVPSEAPSHSVEQEPKVKVAFKPSLRFRSPAEKPKVDENSEEQVLPTPEEVIAPGIVSLEALDRMFAALDRLQKERERLERDLRYAKKGKIGFWGKMVARIGGVRVQDAYEAPSVYEQKIFSLDTQIATLQADFIERTRMRSEEYLPTYNRLIEEREREEKELQKILKEKDTSGNDFSPIALRRIKQEKVLEEINQRIIAFEKRWGEKLPEKQAEVVGQKKIKVQIRRKVA